MNADKQEDIKAVSSGAAVKALPSRDESVSKMEPLLLGPRHRPELADLALELAQKSTGFRRSLPPSLLPALAHLVRSMNCYYSNLIEGHDTHPVDIERALQGNYSRDTKKRHLQLEAKAHIAVQEWIDGGGLADRALSTTSICEVHRRFCELLPDDLLWVEDGVTQKRVSVIAGELRTLDVKVGNHLAVSPAVVPRFLERYEQVYSGLGKTEAILSAAAAHHRLLWIHPFLDGNGRVARLISHATLLNVLDTGGVWSVARGLARNVANYKGHLAACDLQRLDEKGNLSEENMAAFTQFFLETCIEEVDFMEALMQPDRLRARILLWAEEEIRLGHLPPKSGNVLEALLYRGELPRADAVSVVGTGVRQARRITSALLESGVLVSDSSRAPLRLAFTAALASRWMPGLFPDKAN